MLGIIRLILRGRLELVMATLFVALSSLLRHLLLSHLNTISLILNRSDVVPNIAHTVSKLAQVQSLELIIKLTIYLVIAIYLVDMGLQVV